MKNQTNSQGIVYYDAIDEHGNPVKRTRAEYPYSYDAYVTWRVGKNEEANDTAYSDRLWQEDSRKYDRLCTEHFGDTSQSFSGRNPEKIEIFLRDFMDNPKLKLIFIMESCNVSSGYPVWRFDYNTNNK